MKTTFVLGAVAAAVAVFSQGAFAQASSPTRAEVKAEAKTGALAPAGEGPGAMGKQPSTMSDKTRAERKATTKADRAAGDLKPAGEAVKPAGSMGKDDKAEKTSTSMTTRADRKAQTKADIQAARPSRPAKRRTVGRAAKEVRPAARIRALQEKKAAPRSRFFFVRGAGPSGLRRLRARSSRTATSDVPSFSRPGTARWP